jgi:hypothetical protein
MIGTFGPRAAPWSNALESDAATLPAALPEAMIAKNLALEGPRLWWPLLHLGT